jgi:hypothetical protein
MSDVRGAILQAGTSLGWQMKVVKPGLIVGYAVRARSYGESRNSL